MVAIALQFGHDLSAVETTLLRLEERYADYHASIRPRPFSRGNPSHHKYMIKLGLNNLKRAGSNNAGLNIRVGTVSKF